MWPSSVYATAIENHETEEIGEIFDAHMENLKKDLKNEKGQYEKNGLNDEANRTGDLLKLAEGEYELSDGKKSKESLKTIRDMIMQTKPAWTLVLGLETLTEQMLLSLAEMENSQFNGIVLEFMILENRYRLPSKGPLSMNPVSLKNEIIAGIDTVITNYGTRELGEKISKERQWIEKKILEATEDISRWWQALRLAELIETLGSIKIGWQHNLRNTARLISYPQYVFGIEYNGFALGYPGSTRAFPRYYGAWIDPNSEDPYSPTIYHGDLYISLTKRQTIIPDHTLIFDANWEQELNEIHQTDKGTPEENWVLQHSIVNDKILLTGSAVQSLSRITDKYESWYLAQSPKLILGPEFLFSGKCKEIIHTRRTGISSINCKTGELEHELIIIDPADRLKKAKPISELLVEYHQGQLKSLEITGKEEISYQPYKNLNLRAKKITINNGNGRGEKKVIIKADSRCSATLLDKPIKIHCSKLACEGQGSQSTDDGKYEIDFSDGAIEIAQQRLDRVKIGRIRVEKDKIQNSLLFFCDNDKTILRLGGLKLEGFRAITYNEFLEPTRIAGISKIFGVPVSFGLETTNLGFAMIRLYAGVYAIHLYDETKDMTLEIHRMKDGTAIKSIKIDIDDLSQVLSLNE
jgi:hypothetical protein